MKTLHRYHFVLVLCLGNFVWAEGLSSFEKALGLQRTDFSKILEVIVDTVGEWFDSEDYVPIGSKEIDIRQMDDIFKSECDSQCASAPLTTVLRYGSEEHYSRFYQGIKNKGTLCQKKVLSSLLQHLKHERIPKECLSDTNTEICQSITEDLKIVQNRILDLMKLIYKDKVQENLDDWCLSENILDIKPVQQMISQLNKEMQCGPLPKGSERQVVSGIGVQDAEYTIKREQDGSYTIPVFMSFSAGPRYDGDFPREEVSHRYMARAQYCMERANEKMLGPNGEKLQIQIQPSSNTCQQVHKISIVEKSSRTNSQNYAANVNCPAVVHEVLHLLGLNDEYKEVSKGYYVDSQTGELFHLSHVSENNWLTQKLVLFQTFRNNTLQEYHEPYARQSKKSLLDDENKYRFQTAYDCRMISEGIMAHHYKQWFNVFYKGTSSSLLKPSDFQLLLYGACEQNQKLNECYQQAYQSSVYNPHCIEKKCACEKHIGVDGEERIKNLQDLFEGYEKTIKEIEAENDNLETAKEDANLIYLDENLDAYTEVEKIKAIEERQEVLAQRKKEAQDNRTHVQKELEQAFQCWGEDKTPLSNLRND